MNKKEIKDLIAKTKIMEAITAMVSILEGKHLDNAKALLCDYKKLKKEGLLGILTWSEVTDRGNKIMIEALALADEIPSSLEASHISDNQ